MKNKNAWLLQEKNRREEIDNLGWIMWSSIITITSIAVQTVSNIFSPHIVWISFIIGLVVYFCIAFTVGQHSEHNEQEIIGLLFFFSLVLIFSGQFISNIYPYIAIFAILIVGYFAGVFYLKIKEKPEEESY